MYLDTLFSKYILICTLRNNVSRHIDMYFEEQCTRHIDPVKYISRPIYVL